MGSVQLAGDQDGGPHPDGGQCGAAEARTQLLRQPLGEVGRRAKERISAEQGQLLV